MYFIHFYTIIQEGWLNITITTEFFEIKFELVLHRMDMSVIFLKNATENDFKYFIFPQELIKFLDKPIDLLSISAKCPINFLIQLGETELERNNGREIVPSSLRKNIWMPNRYWDEEDEEYYMNNES